MLHDAACARTCARSSSTGFGKLSSERGSNGPGKGDFQSPELTVCSGGFSIAAARYASQNASGSGGSKSRSGWLKRIASVPRGRRTRASSASVAAFANQWNASATKTASTASSSSGIASALPLSVCASGTTRSSTARIPSSGSTATTRANRGDQLPRQLAGAGGEVEHDRVRSEPSESIAARRTDAELSRVRRAVRARTAVRTRPAEAPGAASVRVIYPTPARRNARLSRSISRAITSRCTSCVPS